MQTTWILSADASRARIFEVQPAEQHLVEIEDFVNPEGRMQNRDIDSDQEGRYYSKGLAQKQAHSAAEMQGVDHETELFSKELGRYLDKARNDHRYDRLYLIAPPKLLGMLRNNLDKEVQKLVTEELDKDLSWFSERDLERHLKGGTRKRDK
jgi:protein required for attachment to host cells